MNDHMIVVGAGPAGTSTAWHLAQQGVAVTVLDRAIFPRDKVCAEYLSPQATRILSNMHALAPLEAAGASSLTGMRVRSPNGRELVGQFSAKHHFTPFHDAGLGIRRTTLDTILLQQAKMAGARVIEGAHVTDVTYDENNRVNGVQVVDANGQPSTMRASLVIGADGLRSVIARRLGLVRQVTMPKRLALVAHFENVRDLTTMGEMHVEPDGYLGIAAVDCGLTNVAIVVPASEASSIATDRAAYFDAWIRNHPRVASRLSHAVRMTGVRATGPFATRVNRAWAPGAAVVGDAADFLDPFTGEGIYAALRGGELAAPFMMDELARRDGQALAAYDRARKQEFSGKWTVERIIAAIVARPSLMNHATRALARRRDMADVLIGVTGDFIPAREVLRLGYIARLVWYGI